MVATQADASSLDDRSTHKIKNLEDRVLLKLPTKFRQCLYYPVHEFKSLIMLLGFPGPRCLIICLRPGDIIMIDFPLVVK